MHVLTLRTILAAADLETDSVVALETARRLAEAAGASLHVVHVSESASRDEVAKTVSALLSSAGLDAVDTQVHVVPGKPAPAVTSLADRIAADVIVLGPHRGKREARAGGAIGSTALAVVQNATAPCLVVGSPLQLPASQIVVPIDLSETARGALAVALSWASALRPARKSTNGNGTSLTALVVSQSSASEDAEALERELQRIRDDAGSWAGVSIDAEVVRAADAAPAIAQFCEERHADLIVAGTRGNGLDSAERLGSVSAELLRLVTSPLLLVPPAVRAAHAD